MSRAREPSDIIWENRAVTRIGITIRKIFIWLITAAVSLLAFYLIIQTIIIYNGIRELEDPPGTNCNVIES